MTIEPLRPGLSPRQRRRREVLFDYSERYWTQHARHGASLPPVVPRTKQTARRGTGGVVLRRRRTLLGVTLRLRGGGADEEGLSAYELMRLARIRENNAALAALDIVPLAGKPDARMAAAQRKRPGVAEASVQPSRGSTRLAELPRPNYVEEPDDGRAACTRRYRKRRVDRVETTPRAEPTAAGEAEQCVTVSVVGGRDNVRGARDLRLQTDVDS